MIIIPSSKSVVQTIYSYVNGDAVFKARGLYAMLVPGLDYDDMEICNSIGVYKGGISLFDFENQILNRSVLSFKQVDNLLIYPNPTSEYVTIEYDLPNGEQAEFTLFDVLGNVIQQETIQQAKVSINLKDISKGLYTYYYSIGGRNLFTGKLVID